jgi:hypothetical protein
MQLDHLVAARELTSIPAGQIELELVVVPVHGQPPLRSRVVMKVNAYQAVRFAKEKITQFANERISGIFHGDQLSPEGGTRGG